MDADQARSIRQKKRLEEQLDTKARDILDDVDEGKDAKKFLKELEKKYEKEARDLGEKDHEKMEYFGYQIEPFHMKDDRETGKIHRDGFVELNKGKQRENTDAWLDSLEGAEAVSNKIKKQHERPESDDEEPEPLGIKEMFHYRKEIYDILLADETPKQALNRLRPNQQKPVQRAKKNVRKKLKTEENSGEGEGEGKTNGEKSEEKGEENNEEKNKQFNRIIEVCDILCRNGHVDIYSNTKEDIKKRFMKEEDEMIKHDLEDEGKIEDMNPDHNVIES